MNGKKGKTISIRELAGKEWVYPEFKDLVTQEQGSDVCFVTYSLWEAYLIACKEGLKYKPDDSENNITLNFPRQHIQLNIGCNIHYHPRKARRTPLTPTLPKIEMRKNLFMPLVLDEWTTLSEKQKQQIIMKLIEEGIVPAGFLEFQEKQHIKSSESMENSTTNVFKPVLGFWRRFLRVMVTPVDMICIQKEEEC